MFLKIAWRNLLRDRRFTLINLMGLSTGLACALLIFLWVKDELMVDKFNKQDSRLYQVMKNSPNGEGNIETGEHTQGLLAKTMASELPEIEYAVSVRKENSMGVLSFEEKHIRAMAQFADKDFFHIFSYPLIEGNNNSVLSDKYGVVVSDKLALKLFNTTKNIIGKTIAWDHGDEFNGVYTIAGVFKSVPSNASDQFDLLFAYSLYVEKEAGTNGDISYWGSNSVNTYLILKEGTNIDQFNKKIQDFTIAKIRSLSADKDLLKWEGHLFIQRYSDKYLYGHFENGVQAGGRIEYVKLFSIIALFILVIACINFMNLSTAKASRRIRDAGIRKVIGASRKMLVLQYLGESMLMAFLSLLIAIVLVLLLLPPFRLITGKELVLPFHPGLIISVLGITIITGLIAGSYPALFLSGFKPVRVLKGRLSISNGESMVRKGLVVFQFALSAILIVSVLVVYRQMKLIQTTNLGYNKDNIIHFANEGRLNKDMQTFITEVKRIPGVVNASGMDGNMTGIYSQAGGGVDWEGKFPGEGVEFQGLDMDYGMMEILDMQMKEGRLFSKQFGADSSSVILNETAIKAMRLKDPIGKIITLWRHKMQVIGVVKDFHFESLYKKVMPFFLRCTQNNANVFVKIKAGTEAETISRIDKFYSRFNMGLPFEYEFLDEDYQALYASEVRISILARYFAGIAIIISCLGLFGLAAFTAQKRQKEIGIRKVVGATVSNVIMMLSKDFLKLILVAVLIAMPIAWWAVYRWLQSFAYRINIGADIFLIAGLSVIFITVLTISYEAVRAAIANPVKSLRAE